MVGKGRRFKEHIHKPKITSDHQQIIGARGGHGADSRDLMEPDLGLPTS
jgi:hypothetical protein